MSRQGRAQAFDAETEPVTRALDLAHQSLQVTKPWLTSREAAIYVGNKTVNAFREWARRHAIVRRNDDFWCSMF